jgi:hypothetical protein
MLKHLVSLHTPKFHFRSLPFAVSTFVWTAVGFTATVKAVTFVCTTITIVMMSITIVMPSITIVMPSITIVVTSTTIVMMLILVTLSLCCVRGSSNEVISGRYLALTFGAIRRLRMFIPKPVKAQ